MKELIPRDLQQIEMHKLWQAVQQSANLVVITDTNGDIEYANPAFLEFTGYTFDEIKGKNPRILKSGQTPESTYQEMWQALTNGKRWHGEVLNRRKDGSLYWGFLTISPIHDDSSKVIAFLAVEEDITERKSLEDQLKRSNTELIDAMSEIRQFSRMLSHDLKAPLSTIKTALSLIQDLVLKSQDSKVPQLIAASLRCAEQMFTIISEMTQFSKIGVTQDNFQDVDLNQVLAMAIANIEGRIVRSKAQIKSERLPNIKGNKELLVLLFQNLIENGIKYNESPIPVVTVSHKIEDHSAILTFQDNGIGIDPTKIDALFIPFSRLHSRSKYEGSGLGLAGCKKICEMHGGKVWIEPHQGQGSCFCVALPAG